MDEKYLDTKGGYGLAEQQCREAHGGRATGRSIFWRRVATEADMAVSFVHVTGWKPQKGSRIVTLAAWWGCEAPSDAMDQEHLLAQDALCSCLPFLSSLPWMLSRLS